MKKNSFKKFLVIIALLLVILLSILICSKQVIHKEGKIPSKTERNINNKRYSKFRKKHCKYR